MSEHKEIWLEPRCNKVGAWCQRAEDRLWCEDGTLAACEDCGKGAVKYVPATDTEARADAAEALLRDMVTVLDSPEMAELWGECLHLLGGYSGPTIDVDAIRAFLAETAPKPVRLGDEGES